MNARTSILARALVILPLPLALAAALVSACAGGLPGSLEDGRFATCETNDDCIARDAGTEAGICWNLRCVQCLYDTDCAAGAYCADNLCKTLDPKPAEEQDPTDANAKTIDECIKACTDKECIDTCNARFPDAKKKRRGR
ncbi:hypothetical protein [Polyangium mundeleinium]|uniref:Lipoprotein n=1 Tax=Polyangium mundeleinium TaxID=2995306 RepID=A0ABT5ERX2_9BACT|nr:hypothetical protein [Polyangium mundeleinium]MDC0744234.1 hypothetical protein [Polyangium mundeleinium]